jgi:hypothetical protein
MREQKVLPKEFEFYFPRLDNMLLVECHEDSCVTIRMTKDNLSEKQKLFFVRRLAAEGFIPDEYQWFTGSTVGSFGVTWIKDQSWVKLPAVVLRRSNRFMKLLLVASCVLWIAMMRVVFVSPPAPAADPSVNSSSSIAAGPAPDILNRFRSLVPGQPLSELQDQH